MTAIERQERKVNALNEQYKREQEIQQSLSEACGRLSDELHKMQKRAEEQMQVMASKGDELLAAMRELDEMRGK